MRYSWWSWGRLLARVFGKKATLRIGRDVYPARLWRGGYYLDRPFKEHPGDTFVIENNRRGDPT